MAHGRRRLRPSSRSWLSCAASYPRRWAAEGVPPLVEEWAAAQTAHDPDRFVALCTDDVRHEEVVAGFAPTVPFDFA